MLRQTIISLMIVRAVLRDLIFVNNKTKSLLYDSDKKVGTEK